MLRTIALLLSAVAVAGPVWASTGWASTGWASTARPSTVQASTVWAWPVAEPRTIIRPYIAPATPYSAGHRGVDIATSDAMVRSAADGVVHFAGVVVDRPVLSIRHPDGLLSSYEPVTTDLVAGDAVARGDPIGTVLAGHCVSLCLHFGVRRDGEYLSPLVLLGGIPRAVLLPTRRE